MRCLLTVPMTMLAVLRFVLALPYMLHVLATGKVAGHPFFLD